MTPEDLEQIRGITREEIAAAGARIGDRLTETMRGVETKLLTAFHGYASGQVAELRRLDFSDRAIQHQRVAGRELGGCKQAMLGWVAAVCHRYRRRSIEPRLWRQVY